MFFIDGTWLWHNMMSHYTNNGTKIDLSRLPHLIIERLYESLQVPLYYTNTILCASIPVNAHSSDYGAISKRRHFFEMLEQKCGYVVELYEINFKGRRLLKQNRDTNDSWEPKEKCVDIATATNILYYSSNYDLAVVITGDRDFIPALEKTRALGKQVEIASFENSCSRELVDFSPNIIWIDSLIDQITL